MGNAIPTLSAPQSTVEKAHIVWTENALTPSEPTVTMTYAEVALCASTQSAFSILVQEDVQPTSHVDSESAVSWKDFLARPNAEARSYASTGVAEEMTANSASASLANPARLASAHV